MPPAFLTAAPLPLPSLSAPVLPSSRHVPPPRASADPLLVRAARGERVPRPPVWLMRQAGRYMAEFRAYSDNYPFRHRSETPDIAVQLSLQPYRAFHTDAVIMFSDILTPLPALGVEFDLVQGRGPVISSPLRTMQHALQFANTEFNPQQNLPFVADILQTLAHKLKQEDTDTALIGFVGAPFTLAAYAIEGHAKKALSATKRMMYGDEQQTAVLNCILDKLAHVVAQYMVFQVDQGAQVVQMFDSWAHHLSPDQYNMYALPFARKAAEHAKQQRPNTPIIFFANGCGGKLEMLKRELQHVVDVFGLDWSVSMADARKRLGDQVVLQGNVDPSILASGNEQAIRRAVYETVQQAGGEKLILNLGHGVIKETPERSVQVFCEAARSLAKVNA